MSEGFSNPLVGGGGGLVYPSIHSPDFVHDVSGWSINKDGTAEFQSVTALGTITSDVGGQVAELTGGEVSVTNTFDTNPGSVSATSGTGGLVEIFSPQTGAADTSFIASLYSKNGGSLGEPYMQLSNPLVATHPGSGAAETWQPFSAIYGSHFTDGTPAARYRLEPIGSGQQVRFAGQVACTANSLAGTTIGTLPVGYRPAKTCAFLSVNNLSGTSGLGGTVEILSTGQVNILPAATNGNTLWLDGITFPLD